MYSNTEIADVLDRAADMYESEKVEWCQRSWGEKDRATGQALSMCASTAIYAAAGFDMLMSGTAKDDARQSPQLGQAVEGHMLKYLGIHPGFGIPSWNDSHVYTKQQVIDAFKDAAKELRNADH